MWFFVLASLSANQVVQVARTRVEICSDRIWRVVHTPTDEFNDTPSLIVNKDLGPVEVDVRQQGDTWIANTSAVIATISAKGLVTFQSTSGSVLLQELSWNFTSVTDLGQPAYTVQQSWVSRDNEALFGGGQYQNGFVNYRTAPIQMVQYNTEAVVPFFVNSNGHGILWDNYAWTYLNPPSLQLNFSPLHRPRLRWGAIPDRILGPGNGSATGAAQVTIYSSQLISNATGRYHFHVDVGTLFGSGFTTFLELWVVGNETSWIVIRWDNQINFPNSMSGPVDLESNAEYDVFLATTFSYSQFKVFVSVPDRPDITLKSMVGSYVDYYFIFGGSIDGSIAGYRNLTGPTPLYDKSVYGFWQCKERYHSFQEILDSAAGYRSRYIPVDFIVQDYKYWGNLGWGPQWDPTNYPNPAVAIQNLTAQHIKLMVSVWSQFDNFTTFYNAMNDIGSIINGSTYYDPFSPAAREVFYGFVKQAHFDVGVSALWMDATEPPNLVNQNQRVAIGSGNRFLNAYSLMTTQAVADGLRRDFPNTTGARVFQLTRSSFAGQQRTGAALWSGDINGSWEDMKRQVAASLNYQLSGMAYWGEDIGGFFRPKSQYTSRDFKDLLCRWFQFGAFTPIYRVHGYETDTEIWNYGPDVLTRVNNTHNLRYRLLPYTYSAFYHAYTAGSTVQRHLVFDFASDSTVWAIADQFMWGHALMIAPYVNADDSLLSSRRVYLPQQAGQWIDFWNGARVTGDHNWITAITTPDYSPIFVRNCSMVLMGPKLQHAHDVSDTVLELRVYPAADGTFSSCDSHVTWYDDDGASSAYATHGAFATVDFHLDGPNQQIVVGARSGSFDGMIATRLLQVVLVQPMHGYGLEPTADPDFVSMYDGTGVVLVLPQ